MGTYTPPLLRALIPFRLDLVVHPFPAPRVPRARFDFWAVRPNQAFWAVIVALVASLLPTRVQTVTTVLSALLASILDMRLQPAISRLGFRACQKTPPSPIKSTLIVGTLLRLLSGFAQLRLWCVGPNSLGPSGHCLSCPILQLLFHGKLLPLRDTLPTFHLPSPNHPVIFCRLHNPFPWTLEKLCLPVNPTLPSGRRCHRRPILRR